jgi:predicted acylesterase/phospholipase RssA
MKSANPRFGLVLTGGGAKGAYQPTSPETLAFQALNKPGNKFPG